MTPDSYRGVRAAVFGASGFIGHWVARALGASGAHVILVARRGSSLDRRLDRSGTTVLEVDLSSQRAVRKAITASRPAIVFNLAGYGVDRSERDEQMALTINAELPRWIAESLAAPDESSWAGQQLVHAGSALEYGEISGDLSEASEPQPTTLYGQTKLAGTLAVQRACADLGIRGLTARLFTVYGTGEHAGRLLPTLLDATRHNEPIALSAGMQRRDFTYVEDVAEGLLRLGTVSSALPGEIVNLATGLLTEVKVFVTESARVLGIAPHRLHFGALPARAEEMQHDPVSIGRLGELIGWVPATGVAEGVRRTEALRGSRS